MVPQPVGYYQGAPTVFQQQPQPHMQPAGVHPPAASHPHAAAQPAASASTSQTTQPGQSPLHRNPLPPIDARNRPPTYSAALGGRQADGDTNASNQM